MTATAKEYEFLVPGETRCLSSVRWVITRLARRAGFPEDCISQLEIAVDEACANVIEHAYRDLCPTPPIHLVIRLGTDHLAVEILDTGRSFDLQREEIPHFPDHWMSGHERGAGLYLIHRCVDEVSYEVTSSGPNRMRLVKFRADSTDEKTTGSTQNPV